MAQQLRVLTVHSCRRLELSSQHPHDSSQPGEFQFQGIQYPLLASASTCMHMVHISLCSLTHTKINFIWKLISRNSTIVSEVYFKALRSSGNKGEAEEERHWKKAGMGARQSPPGKPTGPYTPWVSGRIPERDTWEARTPRPFSFSTYSLWKGDLKLS